MGGDTTTKSLLQGSVGDEGGTPEEVAGDGAKGRKVREVCDNEGEGGEKGEQGYCGGSVRGGAYGGRQLGNGRGPSLVGVPGREADGGGHVSVVGPDYQG